jgi:hypothetical protein
MTIEQEAIVKLAAIVADLAGMHDLIVSRRECIDIQTSLMLAEPAAPNQTEQLKQGISDLCDLLDDVLGYVPGEDEDEWGFSGEFREIKKRLKEVG